MLRDFTKAAGASSIALCILYGTLVKAKATRLPRVRYGGLNRPLLWQHCFCCILGLIQRQRFSVPCFKCLVFPLHVLLILLTFQVLEVFGIQLKAAQKKVA